MLSRKSMDPKEELQQESWKKYEAAIEEARIRRKVEREERNRKLDEEPLKYSEWLRIFHTGEREADRKYEAEMEQLEKKREAEKEPFQVN